MRLAGQKVKEGSRPGSTERWRSTHGGGSRDLYRQLNGHRGLGLLSIAIAITMTLNQGGAAKDAV